MNNHKEKESMRANKSCDDFHATIEFIGKRWMGIIVYHLLDGPKRYHEILADIPGISDRLLTERLRELEEKGLVLRKVGNTQERKVEYELTEPGRALEKPINSIKNWALENKLQTSINKR